MLNIMINVILPVLLVFLFGYVFKKNVEVSIKPISTLSLHLLIPCLVFVKFYENQIDIQYFYILLFSILLLSLLILINKVYNSISRTSEDVEVATMYSTVFMNAGNYGTPIVLFAYGPEAFTIAISFFVLHLLFMNVIGIYYAKRGLTNWKESLKELLKIPIFYSAFGALTLQLFGINIHSSLLSPIELIAQAAVPTVMLILGMNMAVLRFEKLSFKIVTFGAITRLLISPLLALIIVSLLPISTLSQKVLILISAMPSAVTMVMYAVQYNIKPEIVSSITFITTFLSIITLPIILLLLELYFM